MAVWTGFVWERIARWLDHGPPPNPEPRDPSEAAAIAAAIAGEEEEDRGGAWMRRFLRLARASTGETRVPFLPPKATTLVLRKRQFATTGSGQAGRKLKTKGVSAQYLTIGSASCGCSRRALRTPCHPSAGQILQTTTAAAPAAAAASAVSVGRRRRSGGAGRRRKRKARSGTRRSGTRRNASTNARKRRLFRLPGPSETMTSDRLRPRPREPPQQVPHHHRSLTIASRMQQQQQQQQRQRGGPRWWSCLEQKRRPPPP